MPRIAIFSDIHGNLAALEAVIEDISHQQIDEVLVAGDLVGRGPQGTAVVREIIRRDWPCIRGNHEDYALSFIRKEIPKAWQTEEVWAASRWMANELDKEVIDYIATLPDTLTSRLLPGLRLVHGTPQSNREGIGVWTSDEQRAQYLNEIEEDLLVCAHTHRACECRLPQGLIVNVGSVGLPFNGDWRAQYAILESQDGKQWEVTFRKLPYDRERTLAYYETSGFLHEGKITATLLYKELQRSRPYLVPFLKWAEREQRPPTHATLDDFLKIYDETRPMALFYPEPKPAPIPT